MEITIFTPTYNRAYIIRELYESLRRQTFRDFEWIVIDDGSQDETEQLFSSILKDVNDFPIIYKKVSNGGKHRAINRGLKLATGRLFFIVDSDDSLPEDSLKSIIECEKEIPLELKHEYAGVAGLCGARTGHYIGTTFDGEYLDITYLETNTNGITGDKAEVYYTDVIRKYPFPEFEGENFILESVVWNRIAASGLKLRYINKVTCFCEYLEDGLTKLGNQKFVSTPKGYGLYISQLIQYGRVRKIKKWKKVFDYYRMFCENLSAREMAKNLKMNPIVFYFRMLGMRMFYKLYNR